MPQQRSLTRKTIREVSDNEDFGEEQQYFDESTDLAGFSALLQEEHTALDAADDAPALEDAPSSPMVPKFYSAKKQRRRKVLFAGRRSTRAGAKSFDTHTGI